MTSPRPLHKLARTGRPAELTCALLEDSEASCPWLSDGSGSGSGSASDPYRPTVLSAADVHDALFAFVRRRVRKGKGLAEIQAEVDASTRLPPKAAEAKGADRRRRQGQGQGQEEQPAAVVEAAKE